MKIVATLEVNATTATKTFTTEDLGLTDAEWLALPPDIQEAELQKHIEEMNDQPYWVLDYYKIK